MAKQPTTTTLFDFEFTIKDFDFVADLEVYLHNEEITIWDIKLEAAELFNKDYITDYLESNMQDELSEAYHENDESFEDGKSYYRASLRD
jgi:hypothetical protein